MTKRATLAALAVNQRENGHLVRRTTSRHPSALFAANESLVDLHGAASAAHRRQSALAHRFADTVRHEPSGLEGDAENAVELVAGNALLAASDQVHRLKPEAHSNLAVLKNGADLHGEGLAALVALVRANPGALALHLGNALHAATVRADGAVRPKARLNVSVGRFFVVEMRGGQIRHGRLRFVGTTLTETVGTSSIITPLKLGWGLALR